MTTALATDMPARSRATRFIQFPLTRIIVAAFFTALAAGLAYSLGELDDETARIMWPDLLAAATVLFAYRLYVRWVEQRSAVELSGRRALPELGAGLLIGAGLVTLVIGVLYAVGAYTATGSNPWSIRLVAPLATMAFVGVFEEVLSRGIIFRIVEQSLGSGIALILSSLLFGLAHLPGEGAGVLAIAITVVAGALFAAAYMLTRRLWLSIGIHVAWNYTLGSIFSIAVSGREATGWLAGELSGPDWLTGGAYGLEASVVTLLVLAPLAAYFLWRAWCKGNFMAPFWRAPRTGPQVASATNGT